MTSEDIFTVSVAWLHGFDGGSPITSYTIYTSTGESHTVDPQPCLNSFTLYGVALTTEFWVTASNCVPKEIYNPTLAPPYNSPCTPLTSDNFVQFWTQSAVRTRQSHYNDNHFQQSSYIVV